ncbi:hypothetical protein AOLI_G00054590 [Acnodon oligacanthus]
MPRTCPDSARAPSGTASPREVRKLGVCISVMCVSARLGETFDARAVTASPAAAQLEHALGSGLWVLGSGGAVPLASNHAGPPRLVRARGGDSVVLVIKRAATASAGPHRPRIARLYEASSAARSPRLSAHERLDSQVRPCCQQSGRIPAADEPHAVIPPVRGAPVLDRLSGSRDEVCINIPEQAEREAERGEEGWRDVGIQGLGHCLQRDCVEVVVIEMTDEEWRDNTEHTLSGRPGHTPAWRGAVSD